MQLAVSCDMIIAQIPDREKNDPRFGEGGREMSPKAGNPHTPDDVCHEVRTPAQREHEM